MLRKYYIYLSLVFFIFQNISAKSPIVFKSADAASVGIYIEEISTGKIIDSFEEDRALTPASILKCVTTATALSLCGSEFRFPTVFYVEKDSATNEYEKVLIKPSGDPTLGSRWFDKSGELPSVISSTLSDKGITEFRAGVEVMQDVFLDEGIIPQWEVEDIGESYGVGLFGINWMDNYFESDYIMGNPPEFFVETLMEEMTRKGIDIGRGEESPDSNVKCDTVEIFTYSSPCLKDIMKSLMERSDNLMAEGVLRSIALGESRDSALTREKQFWKDCGIDLSYTRLLDGSGLSRGNTISPKNMGKILSYMARSQKGSEYVEIFPRAGKEGTVKNFMRKTPYAGRLALKSGSMSGVHCYAGYLLDRNLNKPTHVIVIMVNNFYCNRTELRDSMEKYLVKTLSSIK